MQKEEFLSKITPAARADMQQSGILASVTIAQAILESGWGRSAPGNNLFGMKGTGSPQSTLEFVKGSWVRVAEDFRTYSSWAESIRDHSLLLTRNSRYTRVVGEPDYRVACRALQDAGYATDPHYADKLINLIESNHLDRYDVYVSAEGMEREEGEDMLKTDDANKIIAFLAAAWDAADDTEARAEFHRLANELRKASGQPEL